MRLIVTGGGTGGHVFPALECALEAQKRGHEVLYMGAHVGQEGQACAQARVSFVGFPALPFKSLRTLDGWRARLHFLWATLKAQQALKVFRPDALLSTGGFSSAPVVSAAKRLRIPYVIHEQNSVPGRTNIILSRGAHYIATVFHQAERHFPGCRVVRTGMPIRSLLRQRAESTQQENEENPLILVIGGSQGAMALNEVVLKTAHELSLSNLHWIHLTGPKNFDKVSQQAKEMRLGSHYKAYPSLEVEGIANAYAQCSLVLSRSGASTLSELAAFRKPGVFVPYPYAYAQHQTSNALELESLGAGTLISQEKLTPISLGESVLGWLSDKEKQAVSQQAFADWDVIDASSRVTTLLEAAGK